MNRILVIEDEADIADLVALHLQRAGFDCLLAHDGVSGLNMAKTGLPDLILLDLMLPRMNGVRVLSELRRDPATMAIPVIMLTARAQTEDRVAGLEMGADDYVTKPFSPKELVLRIKAVLKRLPSALAHDAQATGSFRLDATHLRCHLGREVFELTLTEYKLLQHLCQHLGHACDRVDLLRSVWGYSDAADSRTLDTHIKRLRNKLGAHAGLLETARGIGYLLRDPAHPA